MTEYLTQVYFGNPLRNWLIAAAILLSTPLIYFVLKKILVHQLSLLASKTETLLDDLVVDALNHTKIWIIWLIGLFFAVNYSLEVSPKIITVLGKITVLALFVQIAFWGHHAIRFWMSRYLKARAEKDMITATTAGLIGFIIHLFFYSIMVLLALHNLGVNIGALLAGLGVGGIAIALAVQSILKDLLASLTIVLDRPFIVGDYITVGDFQGTVEQIGLKTTRVRSISGEQLIFSNSDLLDSRVRNFKRMIERRVVFTIGVIYQSSQEKLEAIPGILRQIIESKPETRFDRAHFSKFSPYSLDFEVVYWVRNPDYGRYMDIQQAINLDVHREFAEKGIEFAYPTQSVLAQLLKQPEAR